MRPYAFRCRPCEWDACPNHFFRGKFHYKLKKGQTDHYEVEEIDKLFEIDDPFWDKYQEKAKKDGVKDDEREVNYD